MDEISADVLQLRELAALCISAAAHGSDESDTASLRRMAAEYEAMANRIEAPLLIKPRLPVSY